MKILFLIRSLGRGGAERQLVLLANGLAKRGHTIHIATFYSGSERRSELVDSISLHNLNKAGRWDVWGFFQRYRRLCEEIRPEIIHSYMPTANVVATLGTIFSKAKLVWGIRTSQMPFHLYEHHRLSQMTDFLTSILSRYPRLIICNSQAGMKWYVSKGYPEAKTTVIPNGIDTERFNRRGDSGSLRAKLNISPSSPIVGFIGRLDPVKNLELLIEAFYQAKPEEFDSYLLIVGDGMSCYRKNLEKYVEARALGKRVIFLPGSEIESAIQSFSIGVSSSVSEGFSNSIAEMMSVGIPCVVTAVGDSSILVGESGIAVRSQSVPDLASGLTTMLSKEPLERGRLGLLARGRIENEFSLIKLVERTEKALSQL